LVDRAAVGRRQLHRPVHDGRQHRVEVERGADGLAHLAQCLELPYRPRQLAGPLFQFGEEPHILDRDDRLVGEAFQQLYLPWRERPDLGPGDGDGPDRRAFVQHRHSQHAWQIAKSLRDRELGVFTILANVRDVHDGPGEDSARGGATTAWRHRKGLPDRLLGLRAETMTCYVMDELAVEPVDGAGPCPAQVEGFPGDGLEDRLNVGRRARNDAEDFARSSLLIECLGYLRVGGREGTILFLQLREEAHVLDGDDGLVGEGAKQLDLLLAEHAGLRPTDKESTDGAILSEHRHAEDRPEP